MVSLEAAQEYAEVLRSGHDRLAKGLHDFLGSSDMMAYLSMMALRLIELRGEAALRAEYDAAALDS